MPFPDHPSPTHPIAMLALPLHLLFTLVAQERHLDAWYRLQSPARNFAKLQNPQLGVFDSTSAIHIGHVNDLCLHRHEIKSHLFCRCLWPSATTHRSRRWPMYGQFGHWLANRVRIQALPAACPQIVESCKGGRLQARNLGYLWSEVGECR